MPTNKNALLRYKILDRCFSDFRRMYDIEALIDKVNEALYDLYGQEVGVRQIRDDIKHMRDRFAYNAPIKAYPYDGRKCYYRYTDREYSIFNNELSEKDVSMLRSTIDMLGRYRGGKNGWLEEVISNLEYRFGIKGNSEKVVSFESNEQLKGIEFLNDIIDSTISHQPLRILYRSFHGVDHDNIVHPHYVKQYNNRWFLFGLEEYEGGIRPTNKVLDRIVSFSRANVTFIENDVINYNDYFKDVIGVTILKEHPAAETITLRFDEDRFPYVVSKPIHPSQKIIDKDKQIIQLNVRPNRELEMQIFSFGPQVEVLAPDWLRQQIKEKTEKTLSNYSSAKIDCTDKQ